jgi:hypothetical protein
VGGGGGGGIGRGSGCNMKGLEVPAVMCQGFGGVVEVEVFILS